MIVLALLAAATAVDCEDFSLRAAEPVPATITVITGEELGGKLKGPPQPGTWARPFTVGELEYGEQGIRIRSSDARFADIQPDALGMQHPCGYSVNDPNWNLGATHLDQSTLNFRKLRDQGGPTAAANAAKKGSLPVLAGYTAGSSWPTYADGKEIFLGLMHSDAGGGETLLVGFSGDPGPSPAHVLARLPMRFDTLSSLPALHSPHLFIRLKGRDTDGTINQLELVMGPLARDALARAFGGPTAANLHLCPVGAEPYVVWTPGVFSIGGRRPDGRPYGSVVQFPFPVPECPTNKLVVFDSFSQAEVSQLAKIIETAEYRQMIEKEPPYYRAYWLASRLGRPEPQALDLLLSAIWEVTPGVFGSARTADSRARFVRYQTEFIRRVRLLPATLVPQERVWLEARAANAARQLGRFNEAREMRRNAMATLKQAPADKGWASYLTKLGKVIARRDDSTEPLDMIPEDMIRFACKDRKINSDFDRATCPTG